MKRFVGAPGMIFAILGRVKLRFAGRGASVAKRGNRTIVLALE